MKTKQQSFRSQAKLDVKAAEDALARFPEDGN
jgi:hypothetical protein